MNNLLRKTYKKTRRVLGRTKRLYKKKISGNGMTPLVVIGLIGLGILAVTLMLGNNDKSKTLAIANSYVQEIQTEAPESNEYSARALVNIIHDDMAGIDNLLNDEKSEAVENEGVSSQDESMDAKSETAAEIVTEEATEAPTEPETPASPYANVAVTNLDDEESYVNVRSEPSTESEILGKIYSDCAATILETVEGEDGSWYYIESGSVTGYIKAKYFLTGEDAEKRAAEIGKIFGRINAGGLRLRTEPSVESDIITSLWEGEIYSVLDDDFDFTKITLGKDDEGNEVAGYVKSEYIDVYVDFDTAISLEEEAARIAEEEERARAAREAEERLEAERLERERQKAEQEEQERQAAAQAERDRQAAAQAERDRQAAAQQQTPAPAPAPAPTPAPAPAPSNNLSTATRDAVVAYAKQFVGNPYVWGGTSLTNGCDCSGFVMGVYKKFGISLPHSSKAQANCGTRIAISNLRPGDLVFYANGSSIYHVAMYIGNGQIVHAINEKRGIGITSMNFSTPYCAITLLG